MASWGDIFVKQATSTPDWTTTADVSFPGSSTAAAGNKVILFITASADTTADTSALVSDGWILDLSLTSSQTTYVLSRTVPMGGINSVTIDFSASNKPVLRLIELTGVSTLHASISHSGSAATGSLVTTVDDAVIFGLVQAVISNGEPTYDTWTNSFSANGTLRSFTSTPYAIPNRVSVGTSYLVTTVAGTYDSTATMGGSGGPTVQDECGLAIAYLIGATPPGVDAGADASVGRNTAFERTASENDGGYAISARSWTIQSGPTGSGTTIGTSTDLSWTPTVTGVYVLRYSATNAGGTSYDDIQVNVVSPVVVTGPDSPIDATLTAGVWRSRIRAEGPGGVSNYSAWSSNFTIDE